MLTEIEKLWRKPDDDTIPHLNIFNRLEPVEANVSEVRLRILGCAATDDSDQFGLELLQRLIDPQHWEMEQKSLDMLTSELITKIRESPPTIVFIASLPPGSLAHALYLCKRLRLSSPDLQFVVGRLGQTRAAYRDRERLLEAGANFVVKSLCETRELLNSRFALLSSTPAPPTAASSGERSVVGK